MNQHCTEAPRTIPLTQLVSNPYDPCPSRGHLSPHELAESIASRGLQQPLLVASAVLLDQPDRFVIVDGHTRRDAIHHLGGGEAQCAVAPYIATRQDLFECAFAANEVRRREVGAINRAISWSKALEDDLYYSVSELARRLQINKEAAKRTLSLLQLPEEILELMRNDPTRIGVSVGTALLEFKEKFGKDETIRYGRALFDPKCCLTADKIRRATALRRSHTPQIAHLSMSETFSVKEGGEGKMKVYTNRVVLDVTVVDQARRKGLRELVTRWIEENKEPWYQ